MEKNYYEWLEINENASSEIIDALTFAYASLSRTIHVVKIKQE